MTGRSADGLPLSWAGSRRPRAPEQKASNPKDDILQARSREIPNGRDIMRRTTLTLTGMTFLGLAIVALPQPSFAQSDQLAGLWQLNLTKSKRTTGPEPKSQTGYIQGEGLNRKLTAVGINAAGNALSQVWSEFVEDGKPHPVAGNPNVDTQTYTRVDAYTININRLKGGKTVGTATLVVSPDGKTMTFNNSTTQATGQQISEVQVWDKQ
jgi:hypothetical protein